MKCNKKEQGSVVVAFLVLLALGIALIYQNFVYNVSYKKNGDSDKDKSSYLNDISKSLNSWYAVNAWSIDSVATPIPSATITSQAAIVPYYGLQVQSSNRLTKNGVSYHTVVAWLPSANATGTNFDQVTGVFSLGTPNTEVKYFIVNGYDIEFRKKSDTAKKVERVSRLFETWFSGKKSSQALSEIGTNWFRTPSCASPDSRFLPCADVSTDISTIMNTQGIADTSSLLNAWGQPIYMTNSNPFTVNLKTSSPWGIVDSGTATGSN